MYQIAAGIQLVLFIILMIIFLKKQGLLVFVDPIKIMFILWIVTLILYDFKLSNLYNPTVQINEIVIGIWASFLILSFFIKLKEEDIHRLFKGFRNRSLYNRYFNISNIIFVIAVLVFAFNVYKYDFAILAKNKIGKQGMDHFAAYIVYMLVLVVEIKYILFRNYKNLIDLIVLILSTIVLLLTLNRGPIAFLFITIALYEVFNFINIKNEISRRTKGLIFGSFIAAILIFIGFFGYIGNLRMNYALTQVLHETLAQHYGMSELVPSGFLWLYIYLTSPLENAAYSIANQAVQYTYFNNLFYPFAKFIANLMGKGAEYKAWVFGRVSYTPYLNEKVGLNAPSFITNAYNDLNLAGLIVYILIYMLIAFLAIWLIKGYLSLSSTCKVLLYTNITSILLWSVFDNSFKIPILLINIIVLLLIEFDYKRLKRLRR